MIEIVRVIRMVRALRIAKVIRNDRLLYGLVVKVIRLIRPKLI